MAPEPDLDPVAALLHLADAAAAGRPVSPSVARWLVDGVQSYLRGGESLDRALGLAGVGWRGCTKHAYQVRNRHLRRACALAGSPAALASEVIKFESRAWPRWRSLATPPASASPLQVELFGAFSAGVRVPSSRPQLWRLCSQH